MHAFSAAARLVFRPLPRLHRRNATISTPALRHFRTGGRSNAGGRSAFVGVLALAPSITLVAAQPPPTLGPHVLGVLEPERPVAREPPQDWWVIVRRLARSVSLRDVLLLGVAAGLAAAAAILGLSTTHLLAVVWDAFSESSSLFTPVLNLVLSFAARFIIQWTASSTLNSVTESMACGWRAELFRTLLESDISTFDATPSAVFVDALADDVKECRDALRSIVGEGVPAVCGIVGGAVSLVFLSQKLSLALAASLPILLGAGNAYAARLRRLSKESAAAQAATSAVAADALSNIRTVRAFTAEDKELEAYTSKLEASSAASRRLGTEIALFNVGSTAVLSALGGLGALYGRALVASGEISRGGLAAFMVQAMHLEKGLETISILVSRTGRALGPAERVVSYLTAETAGGVNARGGLSWGDSPPLDIVLDGVYFAYPTRPDVLALSNFNLHIPPGATVALVGPSGSGKSSVAQLLLRFYDPLVQVPEALLPQHPQQLPQQQQRNAADVIIADVPLLEPSSSVTPSSVSSPPSTSPTSARSAQLSPLTTSLSPSASHASSPSSPSWGGMIRVDGRPLPSVDAHWLRQQVAVVPQDVALFNRSIRDNIAYGAAAASPSPSSSVSQQLSNSAHGASTSASSPSSHSSGVSDAEIEAAARAAHAWEFISALPDGMDTIVGEKGALLSGGQKQRIAIARALLRNPRLIILDEATSALDAETEAAVQSSLMDRGDAAHRRRSVLVIAHRLSTIRAADVVAVLQGGKIVETGTYDELMRRDGVFAALVAKQQGTAAPSLESAGNGTDGGHDEGGADGLVSRRRRAAT